VIRGLTASNDKTARVWDAETGKSSDFASIVPSSMSLRGMLYLLREDPRIGGVVQYFLAISSYDAVPGNCLRVDSKPPFSK
jgi:hypothetical protein